MKRLSPAPSTQTSYYSESMMSESYLGGSRGLAALGSSVLDDALDSSTYWGEPSLPLAAAGDLPEHSRALGQPPQPADWVGPMWGWW